MKLEIMLATTLTACSLLFASSKNEQLSSHPAQLKYQPLDWKVPDGKPYRVLLKNGLVAYIAEDHSLPLVSISGYVKYGSINDPKGKEGMCSLMTELMRTGGTEKYQSDSLDALIDLYAFNVKISSGETQIQFGFSCLSENMNLCLDIMQQMFLHPAFEEKKVRKSIDLFTEGIYHRFDNPGPILSSSYEKAMYSGQVNSRMPTLLSVQSITRDDLVVLHKKIFKTGNMIFAASGNFSKDSVVNKLSAMFPASGALSDPAFPAISIKTPHKLMIVNKPSTQSYVKIGLPFIQRPHKDYYAVSLLNMILGGESFTSRLGSRIRSDEGLAYSVYSNAESNYFFPGTFYIAFHTKTESTCRAIALSIEEVNRLKIKGITGSELEHAKKILIDGFPSMFRSPEDITENYALNEYYKRPDNHFILYPDKIAAITMEDIRRAANTYLNDSAFTYVLVGDTSVIFKNDTIPGFSLRKLKPAIITEPDSIPSLP
jgi:zinc protease